MTDRRLEELFQSLTERYGYEELRRRLERLVENADASVTGNNRPPASKKRGKNKKRSAVEYVDAMNIPLARKHLLRELAQRFQEKAFLPSVGDIKNFFYDHRADSSNIRTRDTSATQVFFLLSSLPIQELQSLVHDRTFSGPSTLASISEAIKSSSKALRGSGGGDASELDPKRR